MLDTKGTLQDQLRDESYDLMEIQSNHSDGMLACTVFLIGVGGLVGLGFQYGWWWMITSASVALVLLAWGFWDARKNWMRTKEQIRDARDARKARQERTTPLAPLTLDPEKFLGGS